MRADLSQSQWWAVGNGEIVGPDAISYARCGTRAWRRVCDELVGAGASVVLYYWAGGRLEWHDGDDADGVWASVRRSVVREPRPGGSLEWTAGVWEGVDGRVLVLLTGHC